MTARCLLILLALLAPTAQAVLPEPGFLIFGEVTGTPPWETSGDARGLTLDIREEGTDVVFAAAVIAEDGTYALRVPIDSVDPQAPGTSRPGQPLDLFLDGRQLDAGSAVVPVDVPDTGERGSYVQLNIDLDAIVNGAAFSVLDGQTVEDAAGGVVDVRMRLDGEVGEVAQTVNWLTVGFTATAASGSLCAPGDDFIPASGVATFQPGQLVLTVPVQLCDDNEPENPEAFLVRLVNPSNGLLLAQDEATVTITDDDGTPTLAVNDIIVREPAAGTAPASFRVSISSTQATPVTFSYATESRTATAGNDFTGVQGTATIQPGERGVDVQVDVLADGVIDDGERFALILSDPVNAVFADAEGLATIIDAANDGTIIVDDGDDQTTLAGPIDLAAHPGGSWLFVANQLGDSISRFDVDADGGGLSNEVSWDEFDVPGADLTELASIELSDDGNWMIATARNFGVDTLNVLAIGVDGIPSFVGLARNAGLDGQSRPFVGLDDINAVSLSPDAAHVYIASGVGNSLAVLSLLGDSPLSMIELEQDGVDDPLDTGGTVEGLEAPTDVIVSQDGRSVYALSPDASTILHFSRNEDAANPSYGELTFRAAYSAASTNTPGLEGASRLALAADGQQLFAVSPASGAVTVFAVGINGELTRIGSAPTDEPGTLSSATALLTTPDAEAVVAASPTPGALHVFKRMPAGNVAAVEVLITGRDAVEGLGGARALAQPVGQPTVVYVAAFDENRVSRIEINVSSLIFRDSFEQ
jgi:6-phosphogluconolactonase (cycloisomerase 2 family)